MVVISAFGKSGQKGVVDADLHHLCGSISEGLSTAFAQPFDVVTPLRLVDPVPSFLLGDRLAIDLLHS